MRNLVKCLFKINKTSIKFTSGGVGNMSINESINVLKLKIFKTHDVQAKSQFGSDEVFYDCLKSLIISYLK